MEDYSIVEKGVTIDFNRSGICDRCPNNQPAPCCTNCPHFKIVDGVNTCLIYDTRADKCEECIKLEKNVDKNGTHADCIDWPQHPLLDSIKIGACKYNFELKNTEDKEIFDEINSRW